MLKIQQTTPLTELDHLVFSRIVPQDHYLRQVVSHVDFECFRPPLDEAYSHSGRPPIDPVRMLKIHFLGFHYKLSDRRVMVRAQTDIAFRWFLQLSMKDMLPNHTSDTYFRQRIGEERFEKVFQAVVTQAREHGLVKDRLRIKDATHIHTTAADVTPMMLVAQVRDRLLHAAKPFFAQWVAEQHTALETLRQTTLEFSDDQRLTSRVEFLRDLATQLRKRVADLPEDAEPNRLAMRKRLNNALALVDKLLVDHWDPKAGDRLASGVDPDARKGKHGGFFTGYLLDIAIDSDSEIITGINVLPANGAEAADAVTLIEKEEKVQGNDVEGLSIDGAGFNGPVLRELTDPNGLNLDVTVPPPEMQSRVTFGPERFTLTVINKNVSELRCPNGQTTCKRNKHKHSDRYEFAASQCSKCPLRKECLEKPESKRGRTVIKNDYEVEYERVKLKATTPQYAVVRREHGKVERKLGELARHHGNRLARYRGIVKTLVQSLLTALVVNVKRIVKLMGAKNWEMANSGQPVRAELAAG